MSEGEPTTAGTTKHSGRQFTGFVLVGAFAAAVNWGSRYIFSASGMSLTLAIICAYVLGMATAYTLSRAFVFEKSGRKVSDEVGRFTIVNVVALVQVWAITVILDRWGLPFLGWSWHNEEIAHAVGVASPIFTSYLGHRYFTFGRSTKTDEDKTVSSEGK